MKMTDSASWKEHTAWLAAFSDALPGDLASPLETAAFEAEAFAKRSGKEGLSFHFFPKEALGESYHLEKTGDEITVRGGETGILYGTYEALTDLVCGRPLPAGLQHPACALRMLDCWDNPDGSVERGYSGRSLWFEGGTFAYETERIRQLGRMLASVGINVLCINNVNVDAAGRSLIGERLPEVAALAQILRPFGVHLMLSADFASPMMLNEYGGPLSTADPLNAAVQQW